MIVGRRSKTIAFVAILALTTFGALATASAQPAASGARRGLSGRRHNYRALNNLALVYQAQGKYTEAEGLFKRALAIRKKRSV